MFLLKKKFYYQQKLALHGFKIAFGNKIKDNLKKVYGSYTRLRSISDSSLKGLKKAQMLSQNQIGTRYKKACWKNS